MTARFKLAEVDSLIQKMTVQIIWKGRPYKVYSLKVGFNKIIAELEKQQKKAVDEIQINIKRLRELGSATPISA